LILSIGLITARGSELKLGILCTDSSGAPLADLLTVELARVEGVAVLERAELDRIVREQSLNRFSGAEVLKVGALAGADGLVILEPRQLSKGVSLNLRVVGVRHGVALGWWDYTVLPEDASAWSKGAALQIRNLLPKLTSPERRAVPISFVGFTSPSLSHGSTLLEREINNLFLQRLGAEPDLLVLERQKLLESAFEKVLSSDDRKFWNGAYLLDGTINRETISEESVTVHFRLIGPEGRIAGESMVSGSRTNLVNLSAQFVQQIRRWLHSESSTVTWDASAEAKRFYDEAEFDVRWGFWPEARAAADAALALGKDDLDTRCLQLTAYTGLFKAAQNETSWRAYKPEYGVLEKYTAPPSPESLQVVLNMACQLEDLAHSPSLIFQSEKLRQSVADALATIGGVTLKFYFGAELRQGNEEKLAELRATMRDVTDRLLDAEETKQIYFLGPRPSDPASSEKMKSVTDVLVVLLKFGPLWQETPEEGVKLHRRLSCTINYETLEDGLDEPRYAYEWAPAACGWNPADRPRADRVWQIFEAEDNLLKQSRWLLLTIASSPSDAGLETNCQTALEFFRTNYDQLAQSGYQTSFAREFEKIWHGQEELVATELRERMLTNEVAQLKSLLAGIDQATATRTFRLVQEYPLVPENRPLDRISLSLTKKQVPSVTPSSETNHLEIEQKLELLNQALQVPNSPEKQAIIERTLELLNQACQLANSPGMQDIIGRALDLLNQAHKLPDGPEKQALLRVAGGQIKVLSSYWRMTEVGRGTAMRPTDSEVVLNKKQVPSATPLFETNRLEIKQTLELLNRATQLPDGPERQGIIERTLELLNQMRQLPNSPEKQTIIERALELLNRARQLPDGPEKHTILYVVEGQINVLSSNWRMTEIRQDTTVRPTDSEVAPKTPPGIRVVAPTNIPHLATKVGFRPAHSPGPITAKFYPLPAAPQKNSVLWADGKLWLGFTLNRQVQYSIGTNAAGERLIEDTYVGSLNLDTGNLEKIQIPARFFQQWQSTVPEFAVFPNRLVFGFPDQLVICNRVTEEFSSIPSPLNSPHLLQVGDRLLLYNAETILETTGELKNFKVLASVRRRPPLNALDSLSTLDPIRLRPVGTNGLLALAGGKIYLLTENQWRTVPTEDSANFTFKPGGGESVFIDQRMGESLVYGDVTVGKGTNVYRAYYFGPGAEQGEIWWSGLAVPDPAFRWSQQLVRDSSGAIPKYTSLPASAPFFWLNGRGFDGTVMACFPFHHQLFTISFPPAKHSRADLRFWSPNLGDPVVFPVSLPTRTFNGNVVVDNQLLIAGDNIIVWSPSMSGLWRVDGNDLFSDMANPDPSSLKEFRRDDTPTDNANVFP